MTVPGAVILWSELSRGVLAQVGKMEKRKTLVQRYEGIKREWK
jgi:hypothetical protein